MPNAVNATLLALLSARDEPVPPLDADGWTTLVREAVRHNVAPLVDARLERGLQQTPPDEVRKALKGYRGRTGIENVRLLTQLAGMLLEWRAQGVAVIVLKGAYLARSVYADPALRSMCDADVLVRREDLARARALLCRHGWRENPNASTTLGGGGHQLPTFQHGAAALELHWAIEDDDSPFAIDSEGLWRRAVPASIGGVKALALSPEDLLLHLALHTAYDHGWLQFQGGLRPLCDIAACLHHFEDQMQWDVLIERAHVWRVHPSVWLTLMLVRDLLHVDIPPAALDMLAPPGADPALVDTAINLVLDSHYRDVFVQLPVLARSWLNKRWHRLPRLTRWRLLAFPRGHSLVKIYPSLGSRALLPLRYAAHWRDLLNEVTRLPFGRDARSLVARERSRVRMLRWLETQ
jgi:hypothetical protein